MHFLQYINWSPDPIIIDLDFIQLRWYSLLFALGFIFSYLILRKRFDKAGLKEEMLDKLTVYVVLATVIGARLGHVFFYDWEYYSDHLAEILLPFRFEPDFHFVGFQGLASHGGAIAILIALIVFAYRHKINVWWLLDQLGMVIPLAGMCIRLGNLMNSEILGKPATVAWAFVFERVDYIPRHPGQLYEAIAYLVIFVALNLFHKKSTPATGITFGLFLILLFSARFLIEFFKTDQSAFEAGMFFNMGQLLSIPFILLGIVLIVWRNNVKKNGDNKPVMEKNEVKPFSGSL